MKKILMGCLLIGVVSLVACTKQNRARNFGGTIKVDLPSGQKLENATWKDSNLYYLIRPMRPGERPEVHEFIESSSYGMLEGKVIFYEH